MLGCKYTGYSFLMTKHEGESMSVRKTSSGTWVVVDMVTLSVFSGETREQALSAWRESRQ